MKKGMSNDVPHMVLSHLQRGALAGALRNRHTLRPPDCNRQREQYESNPSRGRPCCCAQLVAQELLAKGTDYSF